MSSHEPIDVSPGVMRQLHQLSGHVSPVSRSIPRRRAPWAVEPKPQSRLLDAAISIACAGIVLFALAQIARAWLEGRL